MRLAFCFISNNLNRLTNLEKNFKYSIAAPPYVVDSYTLNVLTNPPIRQSIVLGPKWNVKWKSYNTNLPTDFFSIRQDSLDMAGHAELIYVGDDDFIIKREASEAINECCRYMIEHENCGAILLGANFGEEGAKHGDEIYITNNGHLNTNRGIILRNGFGPNGLIDDRFHALGAMEDSIISFTCLMNGYYIARRLHVPIDHYSERNTLMENHNNPNYDLLYLKSGGIWSKVAEHLGGWPDQNIWPVGIWERYRQWAMVNGYKPVYDQDGNIIS